MKIRPLGAELFHADKRTNGRTNMKRLTVALRDANVPKNTRNPVVHFFFAVYVQPL
jgi:hypothetical protein